MSFDSIGDSFIGKNIARDYKLADKLFGKTAADILVDPLNLRKKKETRLDVPAPPPTRVEADVNLAKLDAKERRRRASKSSGSSSGLGTPQLSQPTLSQRLG